jgi:hypothetical protein
MEIMTSMRNGFCNTIEDGYCDDVVQEKLYFGSNRSDDIFSRNCFLNLEKGA